MAEMPRGTVTFLATDLEESTQHVQRLGKEYADLLGGLRGLLRAAFAEHEGWEVDTQGDAFFVAFERVRDAVLAAATAQRAVAGHEWTWDPPPRIRIGLHTTEPHVWEEGYVGVGLTRANRICGVGHGGQVLLSRSTAGVLADEDVEGLGLVDLGEHRLKGLDRPERIFQLLIEGLNNDFRPLNTIEGAGLATETMTVLVTDLEGLTRQVREGTPERFRTLVADYHRTLERVLRETGGRAISAFSDTAIAVFRSARQAVLAAGELQQTVAAHDWPDGIAVAVGVGLDSGEVIITGHGPFGEAANRCAVLSNAAQGGQVLVSEATRSLLEGEDLGELDLVEVEPRPLAKGGRPLRIYELIIPGVAVGEAADRSVAPVSDVDR
jgi:class 3 adenylate cyclase